MQLSCLRCAALMDCIVTPVLPWADRCPQCSIAAAAAVRPQIAHMQEGKADAVGIGYVDVSGCRVFDVLPMDLAATCEECMAEALMEKVERGKVEKCLLH